MSSSSKVISFLLYISVLLLSLVSGEVRYGPVIKIGQGELRGLTQTSRGGREYYRFNGIPFGTVQKRFGMSVPAGGWEGLREAKEQGPPCISSAMLGAIKGSEDCLHLDVYTPKLNQSSTTLLPVMVWIYGGAYLVGSCQEYSGKYFMDEDVVLVVINYRLNVLGFLNTGVEGARGNQALKDQVLALKWVQENIESFSGDKSLVTIFGESAGAISTSLHMFSPMSKGLFHRAIIQSGSAIMPWVKQGLDKGVAFAKEVGQNVDCPTSNMEYLVECLQRIDAKLLHEFGNVLSEFGFNEDHQNMRVSLEKYSTSENDPDVFLSEDPHSLAIQGKFHKVPVMMGSVGWEMHMTAAYVTNHPSVLKKLNKQFGRIMPKSLFYSDTAEDPGEVSSKIREHFLGSEITIDKIWQLEDMLAERHWIHPSRTLAAIYNQVNEYPVYIFNFTKPTRLFDVDPSLAMFLPRTEVEEGQTHRRPTHGDDLPYLFEIGAGMDVLYPNIRNAEEIEFSKRMVAMWVAFAKTGKPGHLWGPYSDEVWAPIGEDIFKCKILHLTAGPRMEDVPKDWAAHDAFWQTLPLKENGGEWESEN